MATYPLDADAIAAARRHPMKRTLPAYIYRRKGGLLYYERRGHKSQRMHHEPGTPEFAMAYALLLKGVKPRRATAGTFDALVRSYMESDRYRKLAPRSKQDYRKVLDWVKRKLGKESVAEFERRDLIRARDANKETIRFANYIVQIMRILMEHAIDEGIIARNPCKGVSLLKSERPGREPWPPALIEAYRATATGRALLILELCIGTGQRIGDVLRMRWGDVDGDGIRVRQGKTGAALWVPFTTQLRRTLAETPRRGLWIVSQDNGKPTSYRGAADLVMAVRRQIGAEAYDLHSLRYTTAAELAALGCGDDLIAAVTGHASVRMVRKYAGPVLQITRAQAAQDRRK